MSRIVHTVSASGTHLVLPLRSYFIDLKSQHTGRVINLRSKKRCGGCDLSMAHPPKFRSGSTLLSICAFLAFSCFGALGGAQSAASKKPKRQPDLIVVISVDMLSGEIMDRYTTDLPGGLGKLLREGAVFQNAYQEHAFTETCPGHSTLLSGRHPNSTGIGNNEWVDSSTGKLIYCVEDPNVQTFGTPSGTAGSSDIHFRGTTFGTWLKHQRPGSRVFAVAVKDRSAIMMAGPNADGVYWFQEGFGFSTSTAYAGALPTWLTRFNAGLMHQLRDKTLVWTPMGSADGLTLPGEWKADLTGQPIVSRLPRVIQTQGFPSDSKAGFLINETQNGSFWNRFRASPFWDQAIFQMAESLIQAEHLGEGSQPDLLCLGLSATNATEHAFGNAGPEIQDDIRRLDNELGIFLDGLKAQGKEVVVVLSADHGGLDFAERLRSQGVPARRVDTKAWLAELQTRVQGELHTNASLVSGGDQQIFINRRTAAPLGNLKDITSKIETIVRAMPEVDSVASLEELQALPYKRFEDPREESLAYRLKFSTPEGRSADILFAFKPLVERDGPPLHDAAQHGTPWDYDRRVPLIFWGAWTSRSTETPASTVDIAPTLAKELGVTPEERLDGIALELKRK